MAESESASISDKFISGIKRVFKRTSETSSQPEKPGYFRAYSGLTLEQFRRGAVVIDGLVYFDKSKTPKVDDEVYFAPGLVHAYCYALDRAGAKYTPLVMSGLLKRASFGGSIKLSSGELFPVDSLWFLNEDKHPQTVLYNLGKNKGKPEQYFHKVDSFSVLENK